MPQTRVLTCPRCESHIRISVRNDGEIAVLDSEEADPPEELREL